MNQVFRIQIIVTLVLIQLIAPLVHAHSTPDYACGGMHVPGLEIFHQAPEAFQATQPPRSNGIIVRIGSGINCTSQGLIHNDQTVIPCSAPIPSVSERQIHTLNPAWLTTRYSSTPTATPPPLRGPPPHS